MFSQFGSGHLELKSSFIQENPVTHSLDLLPKQRSQSKKQQTYFKVIHLEDTTRFPREKEKVNGHLSGANPERPERGDSTGEDSRDPGG